MAPLARNTRPSGSSAPAGTTEGRAPRLRSRLLPRRFVWRIYFHGFVLLFTVALAIFVVGHTMGRPEEHRRPERLARYISYFVDESGWEPTAVAEELVRIEAITGLPLTLYRLDGTVVASNVEPPVPPASMEQVERLHARPLDEPRHPGEPLPMTRGGRLAGYVVVGKPGGPLWTRGLVTLAAVLAALAVASLPLARALGKPVEQLTRAVRRFGEGELGARSGVSRRDELGDLARSFDEMAERMQRLVLGEKELLANVSHELRTPLARIRVALELASEGDIERARRYLGEIATDLNELEGLLENVLTTARLDLSAGRVEPSTLPYRRAPFDAGDLLARSAERFEAVHEDHPLEQLFPAAAVTLEGDSALLRRALDNLLDNAAKYSAPGTPVRLSAATLGGWLLVEVADRGAGIGAEDLARLFTPFFRGDPSRTRQTGGVGLGLALAKRIVEAHGGTIAIESEVGRGTTVRLRLPEMA